MDFVDLIKLGFRRWYVAVPAGVLALLAAFTARSSVDITYMSSGSLLVVAPMRSDGAANRLLTYGNLLVPATIATQVVSDVPARDKLVAEGAAATYEVGLNPSSSAPFIFAQATGTVEQAPRTVEMVLRAVSAELERRQLALGAPPDTWITTEVLTAPTPPTPENGSRTRAFLVVLMLGLGAGAVLTIFADRFGDYRRRRRTSTAIDQGDFLTGGNEWPARQPEEEAVTFRVPVPIGWTARALEQPHEVPQMAPPRIPPDLTAEDAPALQPKESGRRSEPEVRPLRRPHPYLLVPDEEEEPPAARSSGTE